MSNIFDPKSSTGFGGSDVVQFFKQMQTASRWGSAWGLKRKLIKEGYDPITIDAAIEAVKTGRDPTAILAQAEQAYALRAKQSQIRNNPPPVHGSARWANKTDLKPKGLHDAYDGTGLNFGMHGSEPVNWNGESHLLTVAPTRTSKGTMQIIPNLLQYKGSAVVLDPKGELYEATSQWRRENVGPVYALNPFNMPISASEGLTAGSTHAFNPLDTVTDSLSATKLAEMIFPRNPDDRQAFFDSEAIGLLTAVIQFFACYGDEKQRTFGNIRNKLSSISSDLFDLMKAMSHPAMPDPIRNAAKNFLSKSKDTGKPRVIDSLNQHLRLWDNAGLRVCTERTDFDFRDLKDKPATVYLILPFEEIQAYSTFVRMVLATALNAMLENKNTPQIPVLFVLDEFLALDPDERFVSALRTHASAGVRLWFFLQDLPTLEQKYPKTWKSFLQVETQCYFGTSDLHTAKLISESLGQKTIAYEVPNISASTSGGGSASTSYSISENINLTSRQLMTPDEVVTFMVGNTHERTGILFLRDVGRATQIKLTPYFNNSELADRV